MSHLTLEFIIYKFWNDNIHILILQQFYLLLCEILLFESFLLIPVQL